MNGNDSYAQANPHFDTNVGRTLYPEMRAPLAGASEVRVGHWQRFALEVVGGVAHLYVGDTTLPSMTVRSVRRPAARSASSLGTPARASGSTTSGW